ncbi:MAG: DUF4349 domain-containing protein [Candidatus Peregrinibacteria bacterium]|nr:DUF4349 domain-containing protein [Candidatus Peregrinibacteria bacterium]
MAKLQKLFSVAKDFVKQNFFLLIVIFGIGIYLLPESNFPTPLRNSKMNLSMESGMDYEMIESSSPQMTIGRGGGGIMPKVYTDQGFAPEEVNRKIVKNASLNLEVEDTDIAKDLATENVKEFGGLVTNLNSWQIRPGVLAYSMSMKVPAEKLDNLIESLVKLGVKKSENFNISDITAQYRDTENQLKNLEARRNRLRELMDRETDNLSDVLQIDRELSSVQLQIENLERTQQGRDDRVAYSTLNLNIQPEPAIGDFTTPDWHPERSWKEALNDLIFDSQQIIDKLIRLVVYAPIWIPILLILWVIKRRFIK